MHFGWALQCILQNIVNANPAYGPVYMAKIDLADGYYRIALQLEDIPKLGVIFPSNNDKELLVAFPLVLPMGWVKSAPYFCAATETVADVANEQIMQQARPPPHQLDQVVDTPPLQPMITSTATTIKMTNLLHPSHPTQPVANNRCPLGRWEVYINDFCGLAQGNSKRHWHI